MVDTPIVSDALQTRFRTNFPSQINSGRDLHVSDVIVPIVDFSTVAGTTGINETLQSSLAFVNQTSFNIFNTTTTLASSGGFWRIYGVYSIFDGSAVANSGFFLSDGSTDKQIFGVDKNAVATSNDYNFSITYDFTIFLRSGDSLKGTTSNRSNLVGSYRQVADISGVLVNPTGYTGS